MEAGHFLIGRAFSSPCGTARYWRTGWINFLIFSIFVFLHDQSPAFSFHNNAATRIRTCTFAPLLLFLLLLVTASADCNEMAMRMAFRGSVARPLLTPRSSSVRPVLSWAARWKGSAAPTKTDDTGKKEEAPAAEAVAPAADKPKPTAFPTADLPVTFEVSRSAYLEEMSGRVQISQSMESSR